VTLCINALVWKSAPVPDKCRFKDYIIPFDFATGLFFQWQIGGLCAWGGGSDGVVFANMT
jgi:hypothetical protein